MAATAHSPREVFAQWLEKQPDSARVVVACDTDRLLADAKVLDDSKIVDARGRTWNLAAYRGDDLRFRFAFRRAANSGKTAIVLVGSAQPDQRLDVTTIADLLSHDEGTEILDLSLARYLGRFCPQINFPSEPLRHYRDHLLARTDQLASAAKKITSRWGKPDDWGRAQVAALMLLAHAPNLSLDDVWPDVDSPEAFAAHAVRMLTARAELRPLKSVVRDFLRASVSALPSFAAHVHWCEPEPDELAAFLVLRAFASQHHLQNPTVQLAGAGLLAADRDWLPFERTVGRVIQLVRQDGVWLHVETAAAGYLGPKRVEKLLALVGAGSANGVEMANFVAHERLAPIRAEVLTRLILRVLDHPHELAPVIAAWRSAGQSAPVEGDVTPGDTDARPAQAMINLLFVWARIEATLVRTGPDATQPAALLDEFEHGGWHLLETDLGQLPHLAHQSGNLEVLRRVPRLTFGQDGDDLRPLPGSLKDRVRAAQQRFDERLAEIIRVSPDKFVDGGWCSASYVRDRLRKRVDALSVGHGDGRVWILVFDGMRFDTWRTVVRPILAEHFTVTDDRAMFCVPPSFTTVARTSLLAGCGPKNWQGFHGQWTRDEGALAAKCLGLSQPEAKAKLRLQKEAQTLKARQKLSAADADASLVNILIYGISDECHDYFGDFGQFHQKIRNDLLGDPSKGLGGVLDDLLRRVQPEDDVVVVSDHGFTEMLAGDGREVSAAEIAKAGATGDDAVQWRYLVGMPGSETLPVQFDDKTYHMAIGRRWFFRERTKQPARYSHGGCSMAEMVVPAVTLKRVSGKTARVVLDSLSEQIAIPEDETQEIAFHVRNRGNVAVDFSIEARTNLVEVVLQESGRLPAGDSRSLKFTLRGRYGQTPTRDVDPAATLRAVTIRLRHTDLHGATIEPAGGQITVPVHVAPKATKLDTDALAGLDDL